MADAGAEVEGVEPEVLFWCIRADDALRGTMAEKRSCWAASDDRALSKDTYVYIARAGSQLGRHVGGCSLRSAPAPHLAIALCPKAILHASTRLTPVTCARWRPPCNV